jgi:hypothetical protein
MWFIIVSRKKLTLGSGGLEEPNSPNKELIVN